MAKHSAMHMGKTSLGKIKKMHDPLRRNKAITAKRHKKGRK